MSFVEVPPGVRMPTSTTYERWLKRIDEREHREYYAKVEATKRANKWHEEYNRIHHVDTRTTKEKILDRIRKNHPEFKNKMQAVKYMQHKDKVGQKYYALRKAGYLDFQIGHKLKIGRNGKASTGHSGG